MWHAFPPARKSYVLAYVSGSPPSPPRRHIQLLTGRLVSSNTTDSRRFSQRPEPPQPARSLKIDWEVDVGSLAKGVKHLDSPSYQHKGYHL
jgi:hypothetical protein